MSNLLPIGLHYDVPEAAYRADPGLNQSLLKAFGSARTPAHFKHRQEEEREETAELRIGSMVDAAVLSPEKLDKNFVAFEAERRGTVWKDFKEANADKMILTPSELARVGGCVHALINHNDTHRLLGVCNKQVTAIAQHPTLGFRMKGLIDLLPDLERCDPLLSEYVFDLKTAADASPEGFARQCWSLGYNVQAAFYMDLLWYLGRKVKTFGFIVVENQPPHEVAIHYLPINSIEIIEARKKYQQWMIDYTSCLEKGFPGYGDAWTRIEFKPWMLREGEAGRETLL